MTKTTDTQTRGICQCCGRDQAVLATGLMSKHGYEVKHGWFNGVCSGQRYQPLQKDRAQADRIVAMVRADVAELRETLAKLESGAARPMKVKRHNVLNVETKKRETIEVDFADAHPWEQKEAVQSAIWNTKQRAEMGTSFANGLEERANTVHGTELVIVQKAKGPAPILGGEKRKDANGHVLTCAHVDGARVYWTFPRENGTTFKGWTGTQAWRRMPLEA